MADKLPGKLHLFEFHGTNFVDIDRKLTKADCPICGREAHLFIDTETGQWDCKKGCGKGNLYGFIQALLEQSLFNPTGDGKQLIDYYGFSAKSLREWRIKEHPTLADTFIIPAYNAKGALSNLYKLIKIDGRWRALSSPGMNAHPFGQHLLPASFSELEILESWSDAIALWERAAAAGKELAILAAPGAGALKQLSPYLDGTFRQPTKVLDKVRLLFDNDDPGSKGIRHLTNKLIPSLKRQPKRVEAIHWGGLDPKRLRPNADAGSSTLLNSTLPDGYDVRKLLTKMPNTGLKTLHALFQQVEVASPKEEEQPALDPLPCRSFDELLQYWDASRGGALFMTQQIKDTLAIGLATVISTPLGGDDQLWFRIIGPPGSAKSTIAEALSTAKPYVWAKSMFTGLHSGYTGGGKGADEDASLIPQVKNKTIINKDADTLYQQPGFSRIMGELRDIYDKTSRFIYRNKKGGDHENFACTFILCGTDVLRAHSMQTNLGERFLDCEIASDEDVDAVLDVAQDNEFEQLAHSVKLGQATADSNGEPPPNKLLPLKQRTYGFIDYYRDIKNLTVPVQPTASKERIKIYAKLLAYLRAKVPHRTSEDIEYRPRIERPHRLVKQLTRLAFCLANVLQKQEIDDEIMRLVGKVVHDTARGFGYEIVSLLASVTPGSTLYKADRGTSGRLPAKAGLSVMQISRRLNIPETTTRRLLDNLQALGIASRVSESNNSGQRGRNIHLWQLTPQLNTLYSSIHAGSRCGATGKSRPGSMPRRKGGLKPRSRSIAPAK